MINNTVTNSDPCFVDLSDMVEFDAGKNNACLTIVQNGNSSRLRLSPDLYENMNKPEAVEAGFAGDHLVLTPSSSGNKAVNVNQGRYLYNSSLARKVMMLAGIEPTGKGSTAIGSYHFQEHNDKAVAVIFLKTDSNAESA